MKTAWQIGLSLPGVEEGTTYGTPALKVRGQVIACIPTHRSSEPNSLVVGIEPAERVGLLETEPETYYLADHYASGPYVLVRLNRVHIDALRDLLRMAHKRAATMRPGRPHTRSAPRRWRPRHRAGGNST
jgi:hypothetical protein